MEVDRLAYPMIGGAVDSDPVIEESLQGARQLFPGRIENRKVIEAGAPRGGGDPPRLSQVFSPR